MPTTVASGAVEPTWILPEGALTYENVSAGQLVPNPTPPPVTTPIFDGGRYSNPGGSRPPTSTIVTREQ